MQGGESLDVTFSNIRHAFFQESDNELITLVHFTLKNPIMAGKKKVIEVQFYTEVMENNTVCGLPLQTPCPVMGRMPSDVSHATGQDIYPCPP